MIEGFAWWLVILGVAVGVAIVWLIMARLPRAEDDVDDEELVREAGWISRTINAYGGMAPQPLVEEVLELHRQYLTGSALEPSAAMVDDPGVPPAFPREDQQVPPQRPAISPVDHAAADIDHTVAYEASVAAPGAWNGHDGLGSDGERAAFGEPAWSTGGNGAGAAAAWPQDAAPVSGERRNPAVDADDPGQQAAETDVDQAR